MPSRDLTSAARSYFLRFYEGLSFEEVAIVLGITTKATYKIVCKSCGGTQKTIGF